MTSCYRRRPLALAHFVVALGVAVVAVCAAGTDDPAAATTTVASATMPIFPSPTITYGVVIPISSPTTPLAPWDRFPLQATMGLMLPLAYPANDVYIDSPYRVGWIDPPTHIQAEVVGGWIRKVTPLIVKPDYSIQILPMTGTEDPTDTYNYPYGLSELCGTVAPNREQNLYNWRPTQVGWHMLVINQTWVRPTISGTKCMLPYLDTDFFFSTEVFSVAPWPTGGMSPIYQTSAFTTWVGVSTNKPGSLPVDKQPMGTREKVGVGVGAGIAGLGLLGVLVGMWYIRRRRFIQSERLAFERMRPEDREAYLRENPRSILNPNRPAIGCMPSRSCLQALEGDIHGHPGVVRTDEPSAPPPVPPRPPLSPGLRQFVNAQQAVAAQQAAQVQQAAAHQAAQAHLHAAGMRQAAWPTPMRPQWYNVPGQPVSPTHAQTFGMALPQQQVHYAAHSRPPYTYAQPSHF